jgi:hypothetical protein
MLSYSHLHSLAHGTDGRCGTARATSHRATTASSRFDTADDISVTIRIATADDAQALATLAQLDSAVVPPSPALIAEQCGQPRAAMSLRDGSSIADPFHRTAAIVELLSLRAAHLRADRPTRAGRLRRSLTRAFAGAR